MIETGPEKLTKNHRLVYEIVSALPPGRHADAAEIFGVARERQPGIGQSTVYRALDRLRDVGLIHEVRVPGAVSALYEAARHAHAHFLCAACGRVDDIDYAIPTADLARIGEAHGIAIGDVELTFNGLCAACRHERNT